MGEPRGPGGVCPYNISDAVAAEIYRWGGESLGVRYYFPGDTWKAREIGPADWPAIDRLERAGHLRVRKQTGANAVIVWLSMLTCLAMFAVLCVYTWQQQPMAIAALVLFAVASFAAEWAYRRWTGRTIKEEM